MPRDKCWYAWKSTLKDWYSARMSFAAVAMKTLTSLRLPPYAALFATMEGGQAISVRAVQTVDFNLSK